MSTTQQTSPKGKRVFEVDHRGRHLEVYEAAESTGYGFVGYIDSKRSVVGTRPDLVIRGLQKKIADANVIDFTTARLNRLNAGANRLN